MDKSNRLTRLERYLLEEIRAEFKACVYFFCCLFFYIMYKLLGGNTNANIIHIIEMFFLAYGMCYLQIYSMKNFDEGEKFKIRELMLSMVCSGVYSFVSWLGSWFDRSIPVTAGFYGYVIFVYMSVFLVYKIRRILESKALNEDLKAFKERENVYE